MEDLGIQLIVWIAMGIACSAIAHSKGRSEIGWFFVGLLLSCIGVIIILVLPNLREQERLKNLQDAQNQRLQEQLRQERLKSQAFQTHTSARLDSHDSELGISTTQMGTPLIAQSQPVGTLPPSSPFQDEAVGDWYYALDGDSIGPFPLSRMATLIGSGVVQNDTMVYEPSRGEWLMAGACGPLMVYFS